MSLVTHQIGCRRDKNSSHVMPNENIPPLVFLTPTSCMYGSILSSVSQFRPCTYRPIWWHAPPSAYCSPVSRTSLAPALCSSPTLKQVLLTTLIRDTCRPFVYRRLEISFCLSFYSVSLCYRAAVKILLSSNYIGHRLNKGHSYNIVSLMRSPRTVFF